MAATHHDDVGAIFCTERVHDFSCRAAAAAMAAAAAARGSHRRLHLHSSHMLVTYMLLCRPHTHYGRMVNLKPRFFGPGRLIFALAYPFAAPFGNSTQGVNVLRPIQHISK